MNKSCEINKHNNELKMFKLMESSDGAKDINNFKIMDSPDFKINMLIEGMSLLSKAAEENNLELFIKILKNDNLCKDTFEYSTILNLFNLSRFKFIDAMFKYREEFINSVVFGTNYAYLFNSFCSFGALKYILNKKLDLTAEQLFEIAQSAIENEPNNPESIERLKLIINHPNFDINYSDIHYGTIIHITTHFSSRLPIFKFLCTQITDLNYRAPGGLTILESVIDFQNLECLNALFEFDNLSTELGKTFIDRYNRIGRGITFKNYIEQYEQNKKIKLEKNSTKE